ncbi:MAG: hypothetical protein L0Y80_01325 [Ignavibacteriae bacterium]|nr:hypothetical protein [Ignavibacteriota bacterium]
MIVIKLFDSYGLGGSGAVGPLRSIAGIGGGGAVGPLRSIAGIGGGGAVGPLIVA